jgi:hypothetical protein
VEQGHAQFVAENIAQYLDHDVLVLSVGKIRISYRKPDAERPSAALSKSRN